MYKDNLSKVVFVFVSMILGIILSIQFKTAENTAGQGNTPRQREKELVLEYEKTLEHIESLEDTLLGAEEEIKQYEAIEKEKNTDIKSLYKELEKYNMFVGFESIKGSGLIIKIDEPHLEMEVGEEYSIVFENYDLILQLISKLNDLGAEAISINNQRYTNHTSLKAGGNSLVINDRNIRLPLEIQVIGDKDELESGLAVRGNIMWSMKNKYLYDIDIKRKDGIIIPAYDKSIEFNYAKPIKDEK